MKRIINIKQPIEHGEDDATPAQRAEMPSLQRMLRVFCMNYKPTDVQTSDILFQLGMKIRSAKEDFVDLEDIEFKKLMELFGPNPGQLNVYLHGIVMNALRDADKRKLEIQIEEAR